MISTLDFEPGFDDDKHTSRQSVHEKSVYPGLHLEKVNLISLLCDSINFNISIARNSLKYMILSALKIGKMKAN